MLGRETMNIYFDGRLQILEELKCKELETQIRQQLKVEFDELQRLDKKSRQVLNAQREIENKILQLACPRCSQAFVDFEACWALTCPRCKPECGFCGYCLKDCGRDAHRHIRAACPEVPLHVRQLRDDRCFPPGGLQFFFEFHKQRKGMQLQRFLAKIDPEIRREVLNKIRPQLGDEIPAEIEAALYADLRR